MIADWRQEGIRPQRVCAPVTPRKYGERGAWGKKVGKRCFTKCNNSTLLQAKSHKLRQTVLQYKLRLLLVAFRFCSLIHEVHQMVAFGDSWTVADLWGAIAFRKKAKIFLNASENKSSVPFVSPACYVR